jgi:hypothetical protein
MNRAAHNWRVKVGGGILFALVIASGRPVYAQPAVQITGPSDGATVAGTVEITCVANSSQVVFESLFVDSTYIASSPTYKNSNGFTFSSAWASSNVANGSHSLICRGYNSANGTVGQATIGVTVNNSTAAATPTPTPAVQITGPADGATVAGTVQFTCVANSSQVAFESLFVDSTYIASSPTYRNSNGFTFTYAWPSSNVANGSHSLICRGYNSSDGTVGAATAGVTVNNSAASSTPTPSPIATATPSPTATATATPAATPSPTAAVQITGPANGAALSGTVQFTCVSNSSQVAFESLFVDSTYIASSPTYTNTNGFTFTYAWPSSNVANGSHSLICRGYNSANGTVGQATVGVTVNNTTSTPTPSVSSTPTPSPIASETPSPDPPAATPTPVASPSPTPAVQMTSPSDGSTVAGIVQLTCVSNSSQVVFTSLFVDTTYIGSSPTYTNSSGFTYTDAWPSTNVANGSHSLICRGYDSNDGTVGEATVGVTVSNATSTPTPSPIASTTPTSGGTASPSASATPGSGANLSVSTTAAITKVPRIGINLSYWTFWGAEQFSSNVIMNPGFEPTVDRAIVIVNSSSSSGFEDNASWLGRTNNFWTGATFQVLTGTSAGATGTIASSLESDSNGLPSFTTGGNAPALAVGDAISVTQTQASGAPANWWISSGTTAVMNTGDARPGSPGQAVAEIDLQSGSSSRIDSYLDDGYQFGNGANFLPVNGNWQLSFWARATTTSGATLTATFERVNGTSPFVTQTITLTNSWQQYVFNFNANDSGNPGSLDLQFQASGSTGTAVHLDDVQLGSVSDLANGAWRSQLISTLNALHPGYLRDWQNQLGDTAANRLASIFGRGPSRYNPDPTDSQQNFSYSIPDFLNLCAQVGATPWIVLPTTLYKSEYTAIGQYLSQAQSTYNFNEIVVEFGDENWNSVFRGGSIQNPVTMGQAANVGFTLLRAAAGSSVPLHLEVNSQYVNPWIGQQAILNAPQADAVDIGPYFFYSLDSTDSEATALDNLFSMSDEPPLISQMQATTAPLGKSVDVYEVNTSTFDGDAPESQRDPYVAGMVSGSALADRLLTGMVSGVSRQVVFDLAQYNYYISAAVGDVMLWGVANSLADDVSLRPTGLAMEMLNSAIAGDYYPVTTSNTGITAAAFLANSNWSLAIVSANANPTTISLSLPSTGVAPTQAFSLSAATLTSTNDVTADNATGAPQVSIAPITLSGNQVTIPAYGLVVLLPAGASSP